MTIATLLLALPLLSGGDAPDPVQLLSDAADAVRDIDQVTYHLDVSAAGPIAAFFPNTSSDIAYRKVDGVEWLGGELLSKGQGGMTGPGDTLKSMTMRYDGERCESWIDGTDVVTFTEDPAEAQFMVFGGPPVLLELHDAALLAMLHEQGSVTLEGSEMVDGIDCWVIASEKGDGVHKQKGRFLISKDDLLPRRVERVVMVQGLPDGVGDDNKLIMDIRDLTLGDAVAPDAFAHSIPADAQRERWAPPPGMPPLPKPTASSEGGTRAFPAFDLKDIAGQRVTNADVAGKVVVYDFWATWCGPCLRAMPGIQKIHEMFADRDDVVVMGMNLFERGDPAATLESKGITYQNLIGADALANALGFASIPQVFVTDKDGNIVEQFTGYTPNHEVEVERAVRHALGEGGA